MVGCPARPDQDPLGAWVGEPEGVDGLVGVVGLDGVDGLDGAGVAGGDCCWDGVDLPGWLARSSEPLHPATKAMATSRGKMKIFMFLRPPF